MFCSVSISFDFLASGGVDAVARFRVLDPQRHLLSVVPATKKYFPPDAYWDTARLAAELCFMALIFVSFVAEVRWMCRHGPIKWIESVWHPADLTNCTVLMIVYFLRLALLNIADVHEFAPKPGEYADFYEMAFYVHIIQNILGISALLTYGKLIKYLQINTRVSALTRTFMQVRTELFGQARAIAPAIAPAVARALPRAMRMSHALCSSAADRCLRYHHDRFRLRAAPRLRSARPELLDAGTHCGQPLLRHPRRVRLRRAHAGTHTRARARAHTHIHMQHI